MFVLTLFSINVVNEGFGDDQESATSCVPSLIEEKTTECSLDVYLQPSKQNWSPIIVMASVAWPHWQFYLLVPVWLITETHKTDIRFRSQHFQMVPINRQQAIIWTNNGLVFVSFLYYVSRRGFRGTEYSPYVLKNDVHHLLQHQLVAYTGVFSSTQNLPSSSLARDTLLSYQNGTIQSLSNILKWNYKLSLLLFKLVKMYLMCKDASTIILVNRVRLHGYDPNRKKYL